MFGWSSKARLNLFKTTRTILVLHFFPAVCVLRKDRIIDGENPISHGISSDYNILQPFLMLVELPLTRHVTIAWQSCTVFTNSNGKRRTFHRSALTVVFGKLSSGEFCNRSFRRTNNQCYITTASLASFLLAILT